MSDDETELLLEELRSQTTQRVRQSLATANETSAVDHPDDDNLKRSFASDYLDELIIAVLLRYDEANGMDIIRELAHTFGVQFSPGTIYPHLHSLEEEGVLARRKCIQTKEYRVSDEEAAREYLESTLVQFSFLTTFLDVPASPDEQPENIPDTDV